MLNHNSLGATNMLMIAALAAGFACGVAQAQHDEGDVLVEVFNGRIITGVIDADDDITFRDLRVFPSELGEIFPNWTDEPGFDSPDNEFPPDSEVGFDVMDGLRVWNGADFSTLADSTMTIGFGPLEVETGDGFTEGFSIPVAPNGEWHKHLEFTLNDPADDGVYLLGLQLWNTDASIEASATFYFVFNQNMDEDLHDTALDFVEAELVPGMKMKEPTLLAGGRNTWNVNGATPGERVFFGYSFNLGATPLPGCPGVTVALGQGKVLGGAVADAQGRASLSRFVPRAASGRTVHFQAAEPSTCITSNWMTHTYQ